VNRLKELREQKGFTQQGLADALGSHAITISRLERGNMQLTASWMERIAAALGVSMRDLVGEPDEPDEIGRRLADFETKLDQVTAKLNRLMAHLGVKEGQNG
jgi:transcriptional regulator with XRE-family HTH domain